MPQVWADKLEPNTSSIQDRLNAINNFIAAGYDVHVNFSPVIFTEDWLKHYRNLFDELNYAVKEDYKQYVKAEVIFLTHNAKKHEDNVSNQLPGEDLLWSPDNQEEKVSQYGGTNIRYKYKLKSNLIHKWTDLHNKIIPWNTVRYIF